MTKKISLSIIFAIIISFSIFLIIQNNFPEQRVIKEKEFYSQELDLNEKIFVIGSSQVGQLNSTYIHENITNKFHNHQFYNLSYKGDTPSKRIFSIDNVIDMNPKLVIYGISFRDFQENNKEKLFPDPQQFFQNIITDELDFDGRFNPKLTTLENIRKFFSETGFFPKNNVIELKNSPFFSFEPTEVILFSESQLLEQSITQQPVRIEYVNENNEVKNFNLIIQKLRENDIEVVIFINPIHNYALEKITPETKANFAIILNDVKNSYDVKIIDFSKKYVSEDIWANLHHVSYNKKSKIFSEDFVKIIFEELEK